MKQSGWLDHREVVEDSEKEVVEDSEKEVVETNNFK